MLVHVPEAGALLPALQEQRSSLAAGSSAAPRCLPSHLLSTACPCCRNNENLGRLSCKIVSPLVFAHVRAAYPGMPVSEQNCHPFQWGRYMWMHNGVVGGFMKIRRALLASLSDAAYDTVQVPAGVLL